jgi:hypothetical protein
VTEPATLLSTFPLLTETAEFVDTKSGVGIPLMGDKLSLDRTMREGNAGMEMWREGALAADKHAM